MNAHQVCLIFFCYNLWWVIDVIAVKEHFTIAWQSLLYWLFGLDVVDFSLHTLNQAITCSLFPGAANQMLKGSENGLNSGWSVKLFLCFEQEFNHHPEQSGFFQGRMPRVPVLSSASEKQSRFLVSFANIWFKHLMWYGVQICFYDVCLNTIHSHLQS